MGVERAGLALVLVLAAGLAGCGAENQARATGQIVTGGSDETGEYVTSWDWPDYLSKFTPRPGADPAKLIGQKLGSGS
jgi:hypothetical protein